MSASLHVVTAPVPAEQAAPVVLARRGLPASSVAVIVGYLLLGVVPFWPVYPGISQRPFGTFPDYTLSVWFSGWVPHALAHGLNPFFSNAIYAPTGVNLAQNTESPLLGLMTAPLALFASPVVRVNLLMVLAMPVSASAAFVVLRKWQVWTPAAALGGLIYGFSPYMVGQSLSHVVLIFLPLPPFIALTLVSILQRRGSPHRLGVQLGLLVAAQYLIEPEVLAIVAVFTVVALAWLALRQPTNVVETARTMVGPAGIALGVAALLLTYPIFMMLAGPQHFTGTTLPTMNPYHNDLLSFVVPGPLQKVSLGMSSLGQRLDLRIVTVEAGGYIGVPLLILSGILVWRSRRNTRMQLSLVLLLGAALLSLGPYLAVDGRLTHLPLPFLILDHLPLLNDILPSRISFAVCAFLAAVVAFGLDDMHRVDAGQVRSGYARRHWGGGSKSTIFASVVLVVLVVTQLPQWPLSPAYAAPTAASLPSVVQRSVPAGDPVAITYPYATVYNGMRPMLWQVEDGFTFRLLGGYAYHPNSSGGETLLPSPMSPPGLQQFLAAQQSSADIYGPPLPVSPELVATTRATLSRYNVRLVIVDRSVSGSRPVMKLFNDALGPAKVSTAQFSMWTTH